ncbi:Serine protease 27 [Bagarius yarrelli]|uniref:Serine protease 27 n=1 Tax=Bagarius yarrelli TaxID=175774 RepID=A0A556V6J2_BAGYA|nr:Serine protease 27 [Bagarius yarrelli]
MTAQTDTALNVDMLNLECFLVTLLFFVKVCGTAPLNTRIVGGADAQEGSWPWQASLQKSGKHFCGGTLINKDWVMTAAHCAAGLSTTGLLVYLGKRTLIGTNQYEVSRSVSRIISHPKYNSRTIDYDIALMNLKSEVTFTNYIRPVCLASKTSVFPDGTISWISGWGNINYGVSLPSPGVLQEAQVPIVENVRCGTLMKPYSITQNMICAGYAEGGISACQYLFLSVCGRAPLNTRIVGGTNATAGAWPWQVSLQKKSMHFCGGSLVNKDWVVTAAHCFSSTRTAGLLVYFGKQTLSGTNPNEVYRTVSRIIKHPSYNSNTNDYDITLLQLSSSVTFSDYIKPVCLADRASVFPNGTENWITGWGNMASGVSLPSPYVLQEAKVPVVDNPACQKLLQAYNVITARMICAAPLQGGVDTCQGDSGGPMVAKQGDVWVLSGITSWGIGCALPNLPGVYSRVSEFNDWITATIRTNLPGFVTFAPAP